MRRAVFLDRDGVLVHDGGSVTKSEQFSVLEGVPEALWMLKRQGYLLIVVTNQAVVARGLVSEEELDRLHQSLQALLSAQGAPVLDAVYACPHHPNASVNRFKMQCDCRKPKPGMLLKAALDFDLDLRSSHMVGDRRSDVLAGQRAGCCTFLVETGQHLAPPIEGAEEVSASVLPDHVEPHLLAVAKRLGSTL
jgi:D-glycero-D-manno-heptose 1,7-bisphosphate phosphatase